MTELLINLVKNPLLHGVAFFSFILRFSGMLRKYVSEDDKKIIGQWMRGEFKYQWHELFVGLYKNIFGTPFLNKKFYISSAIVSCGVSVFSVSVYIFFYGDRYLPSLMSIEEVVYTALCMIFINYIFDCISIYISIEIFIKMRDGSNVYRLSLYILDVFISFVIGSVSAFILLFLSQSYEEIKDIFHMKLFGNIYSILVNSIEDSVLISYEMLAFLFSGFEGNLFEFGYYDYAFGLLPVFITAFFTTICALVFFLSGMIVNFFSSTSLGKRLVVEEDPVEMLGISAGVTLGGMASLISLLI